MGRVSTCKKNCKTIDLRGAQVNKALWYRTMKMKNFCLYHQNISTESVMYDCQQLQLMYQIHQVKDDNDYT